METNKNVLDDKKTTPEEARSLLKNLCENGFDANAQKLAVALGRDKEEIDRILGGDEKVDEDLMMKVRGIAGQRNLDIE